MDARIAARGLAKVTSLSVVGFMSFLFIMMPEKGIVSIAEPNLLIWITELGLMLFAVTVIAHDLWKT